MIDPKLLLAYWKSVASEISNVEDDLRNRNWNSLIKFSSDCLSLEELLNSTLRQFIISPIKFKHLTMWRINCHDNKGDKNEQ